MSCHHVPGGLQDLLDEIWGRTAEKPRVAQAPTHPREITSAPETMLSPYQFGKKIEDAMDHYIRPMLQKDGGDIEIIDIKDTLVYCRLKGACSDCVAAGQTLKLLIEKTLKDVVDERIRVIQI